jgi:hypothetical protein
MFIAEELAEYQPAHGEIRPVWPFLDQDFSLPLSQSSHRPSRGFVPLRERCRHIVRMNTVVSLSQYDVIAAAPLQRVRSF